MATKWYLKHIKYICMYQFYILIVRMEVTLLYMYVALYVFY